MAFAYVFFTGFCKKYQVLILLTCYKFQHDIENLIQFEKTCYNFFSKKKLINGTYKRLEASDRSPATRSSTTKSLATNTVGSCGWWLVVGGL